MTDRIEARDDNANGDSITGTPGAHPAGTGVGGLSGKGVAEAIDPTQEDAYWRSHYSDRPYVAQGSSYDDYGPAYAFGVDAVNRYPGRTFEEAEPDMSKRWTDSSGTSRLRWDSAKVPARDSWNRVHGVV